MCRSCCGLFPALHVPSIKSVQSPAHTRNKTKKNKKQKNQNKQTKQTNRELLEAVDISLAGNPGRRSSAPSWRPCATATYHRAQQPADHVLVGHRYCCGRQHPVAAGWLWLAGCGLQRLSSCCKTSTTVCGYGTHIRIILCVSVCVVSLLSALPRRRVHAVHASRIGHHVRVTRCAYIISVEVVITPACIALMIGASARGSRLNSACTP